MYNNSALDPQHLDRAQLDTSKKLTALVTWTIAKLGIMLTAVA